MTIPEQMGFAAIFYFEQAFVYYRFFQFQIKLIKY